MTSDRHVSKEKELESLWEVVRTILVLSHGQAQVERGFSTSKELMDINMKQRTLVAKRAIVDYVQHIGGVEKVNINKSMIMAAACARSSYRAYLDEQVEAKKKATAKRKRESEADELDKLKTKKARLEQDVKTLEKSADKLAEKAEATHSHKLIMESNAIRRSVKKKRRKLCS